MKSLGRLHEARVTCGGVAAGEPLELRAHGRRIGREIERRAVFEEAAPLRVEARQRLRSLRARGLLPEDPAQHVGQRDDGRPHVEPKTAAPRARRLCRRGTRSPRIAAPRCRARPRCRRRRGPRDRRRSLRFVLLITVDSREHARVERNGTRPRPRATARRSRRHRPPARRRRAVSALCCRAATQMQRPSRARHGHDFRARHLEQTLGPARRAETARAARRERHFGMRCRHDDVVDHRERPRQAAARARAPCARSRRSSHRARTASGSPTRLLRQRVAAQKQQHGAEHLGGENRHPRGDVGEHERARLLAPVGLRRSAAARLCAARRRRARALARPSASNGIGAARASRSIDASLEHSADRRRGDDAARRKASAARVQRDGERERSRRAL